MDVTCKESIAEAARVVEQAEGKLDILVNRCVKHLLIPHVVF